MQITFNTADDVEELKKIYAILQETISKKCGNVNVISAPVGVQQVSINPAPQAVRMQSYSLPGYVWKIK